MPSTSESSGDRERSRRRVCYRASSWRVHQFAVSWGGGEVCRAAALRVSGALWLWVGGGGGGEPALGAVALALPGAGAGGGALCTVLSGGGGGAEADTAAGLARRLSRALHRPVHVCCGAAFDRLTAPLVERALIAEIKSRPDCF